VEGKVHIISELQPLLADIDDPVARSLYIRELSDRIDVDEQAIQEKIRQMNRPMDRGHQKIQAQTATDPKGSDRISREFKLEKRIVTMLLQYPEMIPDVEKSGIVDRFCNAKLQSIGRVVIENSRNVRMNISELMEAGGHPELKQAIAALAMGELDGWSRKDCLRMIGQYRKISDPDRHQIVAQIKTAEAAGDHETVARLLQLKQQRAQSQKTNTH
jgi:DNA primase